MVLFKIRLMRRTLKTFVWNPDNRIDSLHNESDYQTRVSIVPRLRAQETSFAGVKFAIPVLNCF